ncbi:MAG: FG-GAP repeat protein [Microbacteriaceae bacterium]|nr:FG-GAP repeat protein [Burkholderiaceae bacterium]
MHSLFMQRTAGRALGALTVALSTALAGCGGGEIDSDDGSVSPQSEIGLDGRARALSAGTSTLDAALTESAAVFAPAAGITEAQKFGAPNGMAGDLFGFSVAAFESRVVVGAPQQNINFRFTSDQGTAYLFDASGSLVRELLPASADERRRDDNYGRSVAVSGNVIAVGSPGADDVGQFAGEVFVFSAEGGAQLAKLVPTGTRRNPADGSAFGSAVDVSLDRIVVGAPGTFTNVSDRIGGVGAIYLYDASTKRLIAKVTPQEARPKDNVGHSVAVAGSTVVAGAPFDSFAASEAGAAYVSDPPNGKVRLKLTASDAAALDRFGFAVATSGALIAVGAPFDDDSGSASGSVYLFDAATGARLRKIVATDGGANDQFGISLELVGNHLAVGAWGDNDGAGSVYVFDVTTGLQLGKLVASDAAPGDILGRSVALSGSAVIAGAARDGDRGADSGSVYRFALPTP